MQNNNKDGLDAITYIIIAVSILLLIFGFYLISTIKKEVYIIPESQTTKLQSEIYNITLNTARLRASSNEDVAITEKEGSFILGGTTDTGRKFSVHCYESTNFCSLGYDNGETITYNLTTVTSFINGEEFGLFDYTK